jgi:hypothetical protein
MGRNNAVVIFKVNLCSICTTNEKYMVMEVESPENFNDYKWFLWYISQEGIEIKQLYNDLSMAMKIAVKINIIKPTIHGIIIIDYNGEKGFSIYKNEIQLTRNQFFEIDALFEVS